MKKPKIDTNKPDKFKKEMNYLRKETLLQEPEPLQPNHSSRYFKPKHKKELTDLYALWLEYKKKFPGINDEENSCARGDNGCLWLNFSDPKTEEDFLRYLATKGFNGSVMSGEQCIAQIKNGVLIDPRTDKEFAEGDYEFLITQLDSGKAYGEIPLHQPKLNPRTAI
jgi:hypothetical protein